MTQPANTAAVRNLLGRALSDDDLRDLCYDHFRSVYDHFAAGQTRAQRIHLLIEHCELHGEFDRLLALVREANPAQYAAFEPQLYPQPPAAQSPVIPAPRTSTPTAIPQTKTLPPLTIGSTRTRETDGAVMVYVPAGEFLMGSSDADGLAYDDEKPQQTVSLPAFWIDRTEVTNAQYAKFIAAGGYITRAFWTYAGWRWKEEDNRGQPSYWNDSKWNQSDYPVVGVSWYEAYAYAAWAGGRLPTEAEWEKAARGTDGRLWPWGNQEPDRGLANLGGYVGQTTPVGHYPNGASPYGAWDMAGNVWEWTQSLDLPYPYRNDDGRNDSLVSGRRVVRGGSWFNYRRLARCAFRSWFVPDLSFHFDLGLRLVVSLSAADS